MELSFELLVYDKCATQPPEGLIEVFPAEVRYIRSSEPYDTNEENICEALPYCHGDFIWFLADNDGVELSGIRDLIRLLRLGENDIIVFNSRHGHDERLGGQGAYVTDRVRRVFYDREMACSISTFVERTGFFYWLCAISTVVVRRSVADPEILKRYIGIARIYAHVAWLIEIGKDKRFLFVNRPLVVCGFTLTDHDDETRWRSVGIREGGYAQSIWTGLWLRVLDELIARQAMTLRQVRHTVDINHATRVHFGSNLACRMLEQLGETPEITPQADLEIFSRWLLKLFPSAIFLTALIDDIVAFSAAHNGSLLRIEQDSRFDQTVRTVARDLRARAAWWSRAISDTPWHTHFYVETLRLYDIYDLGSGWVAAHTGFSALAQTLEVIDLPSVPPVFFRAPTYEMLRQLIEAEPLALDGLKSIWAAALPIMTRQDGLAPQSAAESLDVMISPAPPAASGVEVMRLQAELGRQDAQLAQIYGSRLWRLVEGFFGLTPGPTQSQAPAPYLEFDVRIPFSDEDATAYLVRGFSFIEPWGRWTDGPTAIFRCRHPASFEPGLLEVWPAMAWTAVNRHCLVDIVINGRRRTRRRLEADQAFAVRLAARDMAVPELEVVFNILHPKTPDEDPMDDLRALGIGIEALRLSRRSKAAAKK